MRDSLTYRFISPLFAWLPDPTDIPQKRQVTGALIASVVLHVLLFAGAVLLTWLLPEKMEFVQEAPRVQEIEVELVPPPPPPPIPVVAMEEQPVIDPKGLEKSDAAPKRATFQSSQDMVAGSERKGQGLEPLPSQSGADLPFTEFKTQQATLGKGAEPAPEAAPAEPAPPVASPGPPLPPLYKPKPLSKQYLEALARIEKGQGNKVPPIPEPAERVVEQTDEPDPPPVKPPPVKQVTKAAEDEIPLYAKPAPTPPPPPITRVSPVPERQRPVPVLQKPVAPPAPPQQLAMLTTPPPRPQPVKDPGYQPDQRQTRIEGSITNRGKPGVDAEKTPLGVYRQAVSAQIQSRWLYYTKQRMDLLALGTVRVRFFVTQSGRVQGLEVVSNDSNQTFANICEQSVREAQIGPPPADLGIMRDGRMELVFSFTLYSAQ